MLQYHSDPLCSQAALSLTTANVNVSNCFQSSRIAPGGLLFTGYRLSKPLPALHCQRIEVVVPHGVKTAINDEVDWWLQGWDLVQTWISSSLVALSDATNTFGYVKAGNTTILVTDLLNHSDQGVIKWRMWALILNLGRRLVRILPDRFARKLCSLCTDSWVHLR